MSPLGADKTQVLKELKDALRPLAGDALDKAPADANVAALAEAIYKILTADAAASVTQTDNSSFWTWLTAVGAGSAAGPPPVSSLKGKLT
jgi:hypothetical protein